MAKCLHFFSSCTKSFHLKLKNYYILNAGYCLLEKNSFVTRQPIRYLLPVDLHQLTTVMSTPDEDEENHSQGHYSSPDEPEARLMAGAESSGNSFSEYEDVSLMMSGR